MQYGNRPKLDGAGSTGRGRAASEPYPRICKRQSPGRIVTSQSFPAYSNGSQACAFARMTPTFNW